MNSDDGQVVETLDNGRTIFATADWWYLVQPARDNYWIRCASLELAEAVYAASKSEAWSDQGQGPVLDTDDVRLG